MAWRGWSTLNFFRQTSAVLTATPVTIACWAKTSITGSTQIMGGLYTSGSAFNRNAFNLVVGSTNVVSAIAGGGTGGNSASSSTSISANTWFHACGVWTSATSRAAFLNGGGKGTDTVSQTPAGINRTSIGVGDGSSASTPFAPAGTGDIAEYAIWNVALTDAEVASLADGIHPFLVRPSALVAYYPLSGRYSPEINLESNSAIMTMQGTLTQSAHPRIFMPRRAFERRMVYAAGGGPPPRTSDFFLMF